MHRQTDKHKERDSKEKIEKDRERGREGKGEKYLYPGLRLHAWILYSLPHQVRGALVALEHAQNVVRIFEEFLNLRIRVRLLGARLGI